MSFVARLLEVGRQDLDEGMLGRLGSGRGSLWLQRSTRSEEADARRRLGTGKRQGAYASALVDFLRMVSTFAIHLR